MVTTAEVLKKMLVENTGRSMLDSGGIPQYDENGNYTHSAGGYGRNYERNSLVDFDNQPRSWVEFHLRKNKETGLELEILYTASLYHWLLDRVEYEPGMDELFRDFCAESTDSYLDDMVNWVKKIAEERGVEVAGGCYGDSAPERAAIINTAGHESVLSQDIQFLPFVLDDEPFVLLQIHNGADIRGGYTRPRVFGPGSCYDLDYLYMFADGSVVCDTCGARWYTDDAYHWCQDEGAQMDLRGIRGSKNYSVMKFKDLPALEEPVDPDEFAGCLVDLSVYEEKKLPAAVIYVDRETVICPECGKGHIIAL